uniref:Uncharacterized protein n=1 Tax=Salmo trutta TaxID=8032 RepID=A0A673ZW13_SALTR
MFICVTGFVSSRTTFLRFVVGGEQVGRVPCKVASILKAVDSVLKSLRREGSLSKSAICAIHCDTPLMCIVFPAIVCPINIVFVCLFGVKRYGVHINGYCQDENGELRSEWQTVSCMMVLMSGP